MMQVPLAKRVARRRVVMFAGVHAAALAALAMPSWPGLAAFAACHFLTGCFGISLGYHRLLAHRSFRCNDWTTRALATCGTLALQGGPLSWAALHRAHHKRENQEGDPHSARRGFLWSHGLWAMVKAPNGFRFRRIAEQVPDLAEDKYLAWLERNALGINLALFALTCVVAGYQIALWAFPARIVCVWHLTWLVNSVGHGAHRRPSKDRVLEPRGAPRNLRWLALLTYGEGFHANHHARPRAPDFAASSPLDSAYHVLRLMRWLGVGAPTWQTHET